jgi:GDP/UDP-N,N'-diacetylbacillosamine 2-epimerase (hydrolysing)
LTRVVAVVTSGRADYGILLPVLKAIEADAGLCLRLMVTGMHLAPEFGSSEGAIREDGFAIDDRVEILLSSDTAEGTAKSMGLAQLGFAQAFGRERPDLLLVVGDRFEIHACVAAAVPFRIPVAHIHGGEITEGAIDELFRHSITKMAHIHFATTPTYAQRIAQMGEEQWRIHVTGAPGLDNFLGLEIPSREAIATRFDLDLARPTLLATYHPLTLIRKTAANEVDALLTAIEQLGLQVVFTYPNADSGGRALVVRIEAFCARYPNARLAINASQPVYIGLMKHVWAMAGNSSSGIIEAPSFELPVVNVGERQAGRVRARNVIDVDNDRAAIVRGLQQAVSLEFRASLAGLQNPYGKGFASEAIGQVLREVALDDQLLAKKFRDYGDVNSQVVD